MTYDEAVDALYQAPIDQFVAERKRLAGELKDADDKAGATKLGKLQKPPISAWVVNQLWWHARDAFDALFETAEQLRDGKLAASAAHRDAIAKLRQRAQAILSDAGHGATEATLRRVTQTLAALAATGGWEPDPPGALAEDRDPPGFEAIGIASALPEPAPAPAPHAKAKAKAQHADAEEPTAAEQRRIDAAENRRREAEAAVARAEAAAERRRAEEAKAKAKAERHRLEAALRTAHGEITVREREAAKLEKELAAARDMIEQARAVVEDLESRLAQLDD